MKSIPIHTEKDFEQMRSIGKYANELMNELEALIKPGITTQFLDDYSAQFIKKHNLISACLGYTGGGRHAFPKNICTSVNYTICHGIPSDNCILKEGDIIGVDITLIKNGYHGDTCRTFAVGTISKENQNLIETTKQAMYQGINAINNATTRYLNDIGTAIEKFVRQQTKRYAIVEDYCGHGIGTKFHQPPQVEHIKRDHPGPELKPGMFFTIEPMLTLGTKQTRLLQDNWTVITKDYSYSAQFEHTIGITKNGIEIFTN